MTAKARIRHATPTEILATSRLRRYHRQARSARPDGRAAIGSPSSQRSRSTAIASADGYRPRGSFSRHFRQIASRSRSTPGENVRGDDRLLLPDLAERLVDRVGLERRPAGEQGVEHGAQAVDVGRRGDLAPRAGDLLGRHVRRRAQDQAGLRDPAVVLEAAGQAEVGDVGPALAVEQDVGRLQVAVEDAAQVGVVDGAGTPRPSVAPPRPGRCGTGRGAGRGRRPSISLRQRNG